jgi:hypothetical protein
VPGALGRIACRRMVNLPQSRWMTALEIALGVLLPPTGLIIAIILFGTQHVREGVYVLVAACVGFAFWIPLLL